MTRARIIAGLVVVACGASAATWLLTRPHRGTDATAAVTVDTAAVLRTTLTTTMQLSGTLGYSGTVALVDQLPGILTGLPQPGTVIRRGQHACEINGLPVSLFYGARPAWRTFAPGMSDGPDVRQLEENLVALGFGADVTVDDSFNWDTAQAIRNWQTATGQPVTGTVVLGRVVFAASAIHVVSTPAALGGGAMPGQPVLTASSLQPIVTVPVPATQTYLVHRGDRVTVSLPSGVTSTGRVTALSSIAAADDGAGGQSNGPAIASVPALVTLDHPSVAANLDQAPVSVTVIDREVRNAVAVPVTALVALAGGGYAVWVDSAGQSRRLVGVTPGLFADTLVQVTATTLTVGDRVEVPAA